MLSKIFLIFLLSCTTFADEPESHENNEDLIVQTSSGSVQGAFYLSLDDKKLEQFLGIPYAKPPLGDLRFAAPEHVEHWEGVRKATEYGHPCFQFETVPDEHGEAHVKVKEHSSEDCLSLNIWTPHPRPEHAPVLVFIHGGEFFEDGSGCDTKYNGANLAAEEGVIVVNMNYRLGETGFLYFGTEDAPGNVGLMDQAMALEWVHNNIDKFGGDPKQVTLGGIDSGSDSVGLHMLIPSGHKGYFNQAILIDGVPTTPDVVKTGKEALHISHQLAEKTGCMSATEDSHKIVQCLRGLSVEELMNITVKNKDNFDDYFGPVMDGKFIPDHPKLLVKKGEFPDDLKVLLGTSRNAGFNANHYFIGQQPDPHHYINRPQFTELIDDVLDYPSTMVKGAVFHAYTNWTDPECPEELRKQSIDFTTDYYFVCPANKLADTLALYGHEVYLYQFNVEFGKEDYPEWAAYSDDEVPEYMFGIMHKENNNTETQYKVSHGIMDSLGSFLHHGDPTTKALKWPKYNLRNKPYLNVKNKPDVRHFLRAEHCAFWHLTMGRIKSIEKLLQSHH